MTRARSSIRQTDILVTNTSPPRARKTASITSDTACAKVMMNRDMSGWVSVTGPPPAICCRKTWITDPLEPRTLPNRHAARIVRPLRLCMLAAVTRRSAISLEVPMTLVGLTALSDEVSRNRSTPAANAAWMRCCVPMMFVWIAARGARSHRPTCFSAAAWMTMSTPSIRAARTLHIADVGQHEVEVRHMLEAVLQEEGRSLVVVDGNDPLHRQKHELGHDLLADGSRSTGNEHALVGPWARCHRILSTGVGRWQPQQAAGRFGQRRHDRGKAVHLKTP